MKASAYMPYCPPDSLFFDKPDFGGGAFDQTGRDAPAGWQRAQDSDWVNLVPPGELPKQGWKIHVSSTVEDAARALDVCWDYCIEQELMFKFLRGTQVLFLRSSKYGDRTASGKFVTIYPTADQLHDVLRDLDELLQGVRGPSILSDLRWKQGPLYLRYGGFVRREIRSATGELVLAIEDASGQLVPDERRPGFHLPEWLEVPDFITEAIEQRGQGRLTDFPYRPKKALHFSNGGGVYLGEDRDGGTVLLKEARPLAALDTDGSDAVARLEQEHWAMQKLRTLPEVPELYDYRKGHEHWFLVREHIDGRPLNQVMVERNPLFHGDATPEDFARFTEWATDMWARVEDVVTRMHDLGVVFRDLHPGNLLVDEETGALHVIDFESAGEISAQLPQAMGAPAYVAPHEFRGGDVDRHGLGILGIDLFLPLAQLLAWGEDRRGDLMAKVAETFPVDRAAYEARIVDFLTPTAELDPADLLVTAAQPEVPTSGDVAPEDWLGADALTTAHRVSALLAAGINHHATPERTDRLYPGDPTQFRSPAGGIGFLHGAAGVQWALGSSGHDVPEEHKAWLADRVRGHDWDDYGVVEGLTGPALAMLATGAHDEGIALLDRVTELASQDTNLRVTDGLAGLTLALLSVGDDDLTARAEALAPRLLDWREPSAGLTRGKGLMDGKAGPALALLRLHQRTGDTAMLDAAVAAIRAELIECGWNPEVDRVPEMIRQAPSLAAGGGLALVVSAIAAHADDPDLVRLHDRFAEAFAIPLITESGLLHGRAGFMCVLAGTGGAPSLIEQHARDLRLHTVTLDDHAAAIGRFGLRASCDLGTGSAGLIVGLRALHHQGDVPQRVTRPDAGRQSERTAPTPAPTTEGLVVAHG